MKTKLCSVLCIVLMSWSLIGKTQSLTTIGDPDCGQWIKNNSNKDKGWLFGFLSGLNFDLSNKDSLSKLNSVEQAYLFVDNYCRKNPLKSVSDAGADLYLDLMRKNFK